MHTDTLLNNQFPAKLHHSFYYLLNGVYDESEK